MLDKYTNPHAFSVSINHYDSDDYVVSFTDISDSMLEKIELTKEATTDPLTQVYNRNYFNKYIDFILDEHSQIGMKTGIVMFDIDKFKNVNDTYGHDVGDRVLQTIAKTVKEHTRIDDRVIRWGGEEFIVVVAVKSSETLCEIAESLRKRIEETDFQEVGRVMCSFGVALYNENEENIEKTIKKADEKLYNSKNSGRNRVSC